MISSPLARGDVILVTTIDEMERGRPDATRRVFISYRRGDSAGHTGRIRDGLRKRFGPDAVFHDVDTIEPGENFEEVISSGLDSCDVQLVVIGPDWLTIADDSGRRRLDDPDDLLALEIATGLARQDLRVIPVLVGGAAMPQPEQLPESLHDLALRNAVEIRHSKWDVDLAELIEGIGGRSYRLLGLPRMAWVGVLAAVILAVGGYLLWPNPPDVMTGAFRIAVSEFSADNPDLKANAEQLSETVYRGLKAELDVLNSQGFDFELREPKRTGPVDDAVGAAQLAEEIEADVIVYATLTNEGLQPEFYLHQRPAATLGGATHFAGAEELTGQHELGTRILASGIATGGLGPSREVVSALSSRTTALAQFVVGLSYFVAENQRLTLAQEHFQLAAESEGWRDEDGKEVVFLFLGNTAAQLRDFDTAQANYNRAVEVSDGQYGRAHLGLAETAYQLARGTGNCEPGLVDSDGLETAQAEYDRALSLGGASVSDIDIKAAFGSGRVKRCQSHAGIADLWAEAEANFRTVITAYEEGNERVKTLAAEAHAELALILSPADPNGATASEDFNAAIESTQKAIELTTSEQRLQSLYRQLGFFHDYLGQEDKARDAYEAATDLDDEDSSLASPATTTSSSRPGAGTGPAPTPTTQQRVVPWEANPVVVDAAPPAECLAGDLSYCPDDFESMRVLSFDECLFFDPFEECVRRYIDPNDWQNHTFEQCEVWGFDDCSTRLSPTTAGPASTPADSGTTSTTADPGTTSTTAAVDTTTTTANTSSTSTTADVDTTTTTADTSSTSTTEDVSTTSTTAEASTTATSS